MYTRFFRRFILPTVDRLNRTSITRLSSLLAEYEAFSRDQLLELQREKLDRILSWTAENSDFYANFWKKAESERRAESSYPALSGLPIVTKADLRPAVAAGLFPLPAFRGRSLRINTSGSTGAPMTFFRSAEQESWFWALRMRMWRWAGFELGEPYLAINLNARTAWKKKLQDRLFRCTYLSYNADSQNSEFIVECLRSRGIVHINAFSSTLMMLARYMQKHGIQNPGVRVLTATGDNLMPPERHMIEDVFGVRVVDYYGAGGEGVHLASQCLESERYHIHTENAVTEIIKDGRPARAGESGTIVVTQLDNLSMPLIRYDLGDLATVGDDEPCPCGRSHPTLLGIHGRACDMIYTPQGGALLPQFFFIAAFKLLEKVYRYQVIQDRLDHLTIKLVAEEGCDRRMCEKQLRKNIDDRVDGAFQIDFAWVDEISLTEAGKLRPVISQLEGVASAPAPSSEH